MRKHQWFFIILAIGLILRIALNSAVDSFDFYAFVMWAKYLTTHHIADVFEFLPDGYTPYPPIYYYVLGALGHFITFINAWDNKWLTYLIIRTPVFLADITVATLIYQFTRKHFAQKYATIASAFYFLHPAIIYNTSIWGQIDSVVTVLGLLSILTFISKKTALAIAIYTVGVLTKLQILALLPLVAFLSLISKSFRKLIIIISILLPFTTLPFLPIILSKGLKWTWDYFFTIPNWYAYTSVYTYNLWAPFGFIISDNTKLFGLIQYKYIGIALFWIVATLILLPLRQKSRRTPLTILFAGFLLWYDFSFFATRIHSRYLIYSFGFFAPFAPQFPLIALLLSILMVVNLLLPSKDIIVAPLVNFLNQTPVIFVFVTFAFSLFLLSFRAYRTLLYEKK